MRNALVVLLALVMALTLCACGTSEEDPVGTSGSEAAPGSASSQVAVVDCPVLQDTNFGNVYLDMTIDEFNARGFEYGDRLDVVFSNGFELLDIPYYNGYYVNVGDPLVVAYPGYPHVAIALSYGALWDEAGLAEGDTATVTLDKEGFFAAEQAAFDIAYTDERGDYASDEAFANFRALSGGRLKAGVAYRSASPIDNEHGRASYVEDLMKQVGVAYVLDLSDDAEEADEFVAEDAEAGVDVSYFTALREAGKVGLLNLSANYPSQDFARALAAGLAQMAEHDGPYLVHCVEGKDRTGFVCILLEALAGASYDELQADYMATYANYYGITRDGDPDKYEAICGLNLDGMLTFLAGVDDEADLRSIDYSGPARQYLLDGGMTSEQVDALVGRLCE